MMKQQLISCAAILLLACGMKAQDTATVAQDTLKPKIENNAFDYGSIVLEVGGGMATYWTGTYSQGTVSGSSKTIQEYGRSSSLVIPVSLEYGLRRWFGFGARFAYQQFNEPADATTGIKPSQRSLDIDLLFSFHIIKSPKFDMPISLIWGYSNLKVDFNDPLEKVGEDHGFNGGIMVSPRYYFTKNIGAYVNLGILNLVYPSVEYADKNNPDLNAAGSWTISKGGSGLNFGAGLVFKI